MLILFAIGIVVGAFGALLGLGGGILLIPLITTFWGIPIKMAIGTSALCVVATSSAAVLLAGLVLSAIAHQPVPSKALSFNQVLDGLKTGSPASFLSLGILLLIATPVLRLVGSLFEFVATLDWRYGFVTSLVLLILTISVFIGNI
jgi:uncharacterized membrane protein